MVLDVVAVVVAAADVAAVAAVAVAAAAADDGVAEVFAAVRLDCWALSTAEEALSHRDCVLVGRLGSRLQGEYNDIHQAFLPSPRPSAHQLEQHCQQMRSPR